MKETNERFGMLLLFDAIGLLLTTIVLTMFLSKLTNSLDMNILVLSIFFFGIKVLLMGISDITGIGKKIWVGILFVLFSDLLILAINILMAFGISNKVILITAGVDILIIVLVRIIWKSAFKVKESVEGPGQEDISRSDLFNYESEKENEKWTPTQFFENPDQLEKQPEMTMDDLQTTQSLIEDPIVQVGTESLMPITEDNPKYSELFDQTYSDSESIEMNKNENNAVDDMLEFDFQKTERPSDAPNLEALDAFFGESTNHAKGVKEEVTQEDLASVLSTKEQYQNDIRDTVVLSDVIEEIDELYENGIEKENAALLKENKIENAETSQKMDDLTQEMNRQFEVLQNRVDNLEQREADLKRREEAFKQSSTVTVRPQEVHLDNAESEIIINEDDLALLKAYLKQHPEI